MNADISVVIPLYNKEREIGATLRSVLSQSLLPSEVIVVDDGSTDRSAAEAEAAAAGAPVPVRLIRQANAGVSAARNRGIAEAQSSLVALLDGDDLWESGFLAEIARLRERYPECGLYATAFAVVSDDGVFPSPSPDYYGIIGDFFEESAHRYIAIPSAVAIPKHVFDEVGGFPEGMKIGEDLHLWIRIARRYRVAFSPARLVRYSKVAVNRSAAIYTPELTRNSFEELLSGAESRAEREFIARAALGKALVICAKGGTAEARRAARTFAYTRTYRTTLWKIRILNRLPAAWRPTLLNAYNAIAWRLARKGL